MDSSSSCLLCLVDYSASLGSEEESGKDWDELEEEARKGLCLQLILDPLSLKMIKLDDHLVFCCSDIKVGA